MLKLLTYISAHHKQQSGSPAARGDLWLWLLAYSGYSDEDVREVGHVDFKVFCNIYILIQVSKMNY